MHNLPVREQINRQIKRAKEHLGRIAIMHGQDSAEYHKAAQALDATFRLYDGLCGNEPPVFKRLPAGREVSHG